MDMAIVETIREQIGGLALRMMGAKNLTTTDGYNLAFHIRGSKRVKGIDIRLNALDLYDVTFRYWRAGKIKVVVDSIHHSKGG